MADGATRLTGLLGIEHPIVLGPFGGLSSVGASVSGSHTLRLNGRSVAARSAAAVSAMRPAS